MSPPVWPPFSVKPRSDLNADNSTPITKVHSGNEVLAHFRKRERENGIGTIRGLAADAEIHCFKAPSFDNEVAVFVTYARDNELKPHVLHYVQSLRRERISVVLIINAERPLMVSTGGLSSQVDGLFVRQNEGYDFAAWAHVLQLHRGLLEASILYLINDSLIGPIDQSEFSDLINEIRDSKADVIGLTENLEKCWHLQSYFLAFKERALKSAAFDEFMQAVVCFEDKRDVVREYELRLANVLKAAGLDCEPVFRARDAHNPTTGHWKELLESRFPFVKTEVISNPSVDADPADCLELLSARGFDVRLAEWAAPTGPAPACGAARARHHAPADQSGRSGPAGRGHDPRRGSAWRRSHGSRRRGRRQRHWIKARAKYQSAKLSAIRAGDDELLAELQGAMSAWAAGKAGGISIDALIRAVGIVPTLRAFDRARRESLPTPILRRYRDAQITTSRRLRLDHRHVGASCGAVTISILMPVYKTPLIFLERALLSVVCQTYQDWELCVVDSGSGDAGITAVLDYYEALDQRIRTARIPDNAGISHATNIALEMASGSYIGLLDHDDMLASDTLETIADHLIKDPTIDLVYTDECKIDENDIVQYLMPKPDWSPAIVDGVYVHWTFFSVPNVARSSFRRAADPSMIFHRITIWRCASPRWNQRWPIFAATIMAGGWQRVALRRRQALRARKAISPLSRMQLIVAGGTAWQSRSRPPTVLFAAIGEDAPLVSIVIPTGGNIQLLSRCVSAIFENTIYENFEIIIVR